MKTIYIILTKSTTALSRVIGAVTSEPYTHVAISLDSSFKHLYSFSRLHPDRPLPAGFVVESPYTGYMGLHPEMPCEVYEMKVSAHSYKKISSRISQMSERPEEYLYSILGTLYCWFSIKHKRPNHYFCSQFIGELLKESGAAILPKHESLMHPSDYRSMSSLKLIYHGNVRGLVTHYLVKINQEKKYISPVTIRRFA